MFRRWPDGLPLGVHVYGVELPGRGTRFAERPFTRLGPLVHAVAGALGPFLSQPFALFGHSMGGLVAFELACELRAEHGVSPDQLLVAGYRAPQLPDRDEPVSALPDAEFVRRVRRLGGMADEVAERADFAEVFLPALRADFTVCEEYEYRPRPRLSCPVCCLGGVQDASVRRNELEGWRDRTTGEFTLRMLPGGHFFVQEVEPLVVLAVAEHIERAVGTAA